MPDRLPRELRVLYDLARVMATGPTSREEVVARMRSAIRAAFGFHDVRLVGENAERVDHVLLDAALEERRAVATREQAAVPVFVEGRSIGYLVADKGGTPLRLAPIDLDLLSALGLIGGLFIEKAEQYEQLQNALDELRRIDELKDEFVSIASHELRTPIAVVHGVSATLYQRQDELTFEQVKELRQMLYEQTCRLRDLTEQLLDLSRLDSGRIRVEPIAFRPRDVVEMLVARIAPDRQHDVEIAVDPRLEIVSDPHAFDRVVGNLVGNALKHGGPPVVVSGWSEAGVLRVVVEDSGPGVPTEFVPQLFDRFTRADASRGVGGAGLGLAIAREFAEALSAELDYDEGASGGARFVFALPEVMPSAARR
jgi:two-component system, OmpR family, sensor histidine kinase MtrB